MPVITDTPGMHKRHQALLLLVFGSLLVMQSFAAKVAVKPPPLVRVAIIEPKASDSVCCTSNEVTCNELKLHHRCLWNSTSHECVGPFNACAELIRNGFACPFTSGDCMITKDAKCVAFELSVWERVKEAFDNLLWPVGHEEEQWRLIIVSTWCGFAAIFCVYRLCTYCIAKRALQRQRAEWKKQASEQPDGFVHLTRPPSFRARAISRAHSVPPVSRT